MRLARSASSGLRRDGSEEATAASRFLSCRCGRSHACAGLSRWSEERSVMLTLVDLSVPASVVKLLGDGGREGRAKKSVRFAFCWRAQMKSLARQAVKAAHLINLPS